MNEWISRTYQALGTKIDLTLFGRGQEALLQQAYALICHYEDLLTVNRPDSELMSVNKSAGKQPIRVSAEVYELTKCALKASQENFGFNLAIGPLVQLWRIGFDDARRPPEAEIQKALALTKSAKIILDDREQSIYLAEKGMSLDLGGIAKGYIADRLTKVWQEAGVSAGIINLGGNVRFLGDREGRSWCLGIRHPLQAEKSVILQVNSPACSVVTSGINQRQLKVAGKTYHHILDANTGYPYDSDWASVTVFSRTGVQGELEAKRLFFAEHLSEEWLKSSPDFYGAIAITREKKIKLLGIKPKDIRLLDDSFEILR